MTKRLEGKVAIVTGATSGIGRAIAVLFAREGAKVVATGRNREQGAKTLGQIEAAGGEGRFITHDVSSEANWQEVIDETLTAHGKLDVLVNNAGAFFIRSLPETTDDDWNLLWTVNVDGTFLGTKLGMIAMKKSGVGGSIINMSSLLGLIGFQNNSAYCATKGAITHMTKAAAIDGAAEAPRVRVNSVHPGVIWTEMLSDEFGEDEALKNFMIEDTPFKRLGTADDIAYGTLYLASDAARYVTGSTLTIDGGRGAD